MKKRFMVSLLVLAAVGMAPAQGMAEQEFTVGICQFSRHESLDAASEGFKAALRERLGDRVDFAEHNANGELALCAAGVNDLVSKQVDLILANATGALQVASNATADIPILGTAVTDYGEDRGANVSGTSDLVEASELAAMIRELFSEENRIGVVYCSAESNSRYQAEALGAELESLGYSWEDYRFVDSSDISSVTMTAAKECDMLYIPTDNTVASNAELIANICVPAGVPVVTGDESTCGICGVAVLAVDYYELGYATGEMAAEILLEEKSIADLPIQYASGFTRKYNEEICLRLGLSVPESFVPLGST